MREIELPPPHDLREFQRRIHADRRARRREETDRRVRLWGRRISDVSGWCYSGAVRVVQFPAYVFDLLDRHGKPDHSKIGPFIVTLALLFLQGWDVIINKRALDPVICILIGTLSFCSMSLMRYFIERTRMTATSVVERIDVREEFIRTEDQLPKRNDDERGLPQ